MQTIKKRSEPEGLSEERTGKADKIYKLDLALESTARDIEAASRSVQQAQMELNRSRSCLLHRHAAEAILKFMRAHQSGKTSVLCVGEGEIRNIIVSLFEKEPPIPGWINPFVNLFCVIRPDSRKVVDLIEKSLGEGAFSEFVSSVSVSFQGSSYLTCDDERALVWLDALKTEEIKCERENYIDVGYWYDAYEYIFYTNLKKKK